MKISIFMLTTLISSAIALQQFAELSFEKKTIKFPDSPEGVVLEHYLKYTNTGNAPLVFETFKVSCPCTKVELPTEAIAPGKTDSLLITFDTKGKSYYQDREILIFSNTKKKVDKIRLKVFVQ
jgi:hypothetical protein